jgi:hypothetical protein
MKKLTHLEDIRAELAAQDALLHGATDGIDPETDATDEVDFLEQVFALRFGSTARAPRLVRPAHGFLLRA